MNKEYKTNGNELIIIDQFGRKTKRPLTNNFKDILMTENTIEEIEKLINKEKIDQANYKKKIKMAILLKASVSVLWFLNFILSICNGKFPLICLHFILSGMWGIQAYAEIRPSSKLLQISKNSVEILEEQLKEEKNKLINLEKNKENNLNFRNELSGSVPTSEKIKNLKTKLEVIYDYTNNKRSYIRAYKNNILKEKASYWYKDDDLLLLEELIKNDLEKNTQTNKGKQKVLTNKKNIRKF